MLLLYKLRRFAIYRNRHFVCMHMRISINIKRKTLLVCIVDASVIKFCNPKYNSQLNIWISNNICDCWRRACGRWDFEDLNFMEISWKFEIVFTILTDTYNSYSLIDRTIFGRTNMENRTYLYIAIFYIASASLSAWVKRSARKEYTFKIDASHVQLWLDLWPETVI